MARQLVTGRVDVGLLSAAGQPQNLFGEAVAGIGAALGGAIEEGFGKKDDLDSQEKKDDEKFVKEYESNNISNINEDEVLSDIEAGEKEANALLDEQYEDDVLNEYMDGFDEDDVVSKNNSGGLYSKQEAWDLNLEGIKQKYPNFQAYAQDKSTASNLTEDKRKYAEALGIKYYDEAKHGKDFLKWKASGMGKSVSATPRLKNNNNPLLRRQVRGSGVNNLANVFSSGSVASNMSKGVPTTAFDSGMQSGYKEGRTYVEKVRRLSAPSWMGVGAAAVEGYNLSADRINYRRQVSADLQDYYEDKFADAEVQSSGIDVLDESLKELSHAKKQQFIDHQKSRAQMFRDGKGAEWTAKNNMLTSFGKEAKQIQEAMLATRKTLREGVENDSYDFEASGPAATDQATSFMKDGSLIGVVQKEDGSLAVGGKTRGGIGYLKSAKAFANSPIKLVPKKNAFDYVAGVTEKFEKMYGDKFTTTQDANGNLIKKPISMDAIKPYLMRMFDTELDSENIVRAYASRNNWDDEGLDYDSFNTAVKNGINPKDFVKQKMYEVAAQLLNPYQAQREEKVTGVSTQREKAILDQQKRDTKANQAAQKEQEYTSAAIDLLGNSSEFEIYKQKLEDGEIIESSEQFYKLFPNLKKIVGSKGISTLDVSDGVATFYGKQVDRDGKKTTPIPYVLDLSQPYETILQQVANMVKETGYIQVDKKSNFRTKYNYN